MSRTHWLQTPSGPRGPFTLPELVTAAREQRYKRELRRLVLPPEPPNTPPMRPPPGAPVQEDILDSLAGRGPLTIQGLMDDTGRWESPRNLWRLLTKLSCKGWVVRQSNPRRSRRHDPMRWQITKEGRAALALLRRRAA